MSHRSPPPTHENETNAMWRAWYAEKRRAAETHRARDLAELTALAAAGVLTVQTFTDYHVRLTGPAGTLDYYPSRGTIVQGQTRVYLPNGKRTSLRLALSMIGVSVP